MGKSILALLVFFTLCANLCLGQTYIGAFGGLNSSLLSGDVPATAKYNRLAGANIGALVSIELNEIIYLSIQPSYSQEGTKVSYKISGFEEPIDSFKIRLNYFSLPVLLKVTSTNKRFYALGGFEFAALLNSSAISESETESLNENVAQWNLAMHFGVGLYIPIGYPRLFVEVRYSQGIMNLTDEPLNNNIIPRVKTSGIKLMVGVEIPLKKLNN